MFEEAGVIVTEVMLADELNVDELDYVVGEEEDEYIRGEDVNNEETKEGYGSEEGDGGEEYNEEEEEETVEDWEWYVRQRWCGEEQGEPEPEPE